MDKSLAIVGTAENKDEMLQMSMNWATAKRNSRRYLRALEIVGLEGTASFAEIVGVGEGEVERDWMAEVVVEAIGFGSGRVGYKGRESKEMFWRKKVIEYVGADNLAFIPSFEKLQLGTIFWAFSKCKRAVA